MKLTPDKYNIYIDGKQIQFTEGEFNHEIKEPIEPFELEEALIVAQTRIRRGISKRNERRLNTKPMIRLGSYRFKQR